MLATYPIYFYASSGCIQCHIAKMKKQKKKKTKQTNTHTHHSFLSLVFYEEESLNCKKTNCLLMIAVMFLLGAVLFSVK
jgi:hypothetical protein